MKVLYIIDTLEGYGAEKSIVQIAMGMNRVIPVFVHLYKGDKLKPTLEKAGIKVYSINISSAYRYKEALERILPIIKKENPQIIHSTLFRADMVTRKLKKFFPHILLVGSIVSNSYSKRRYSEMPLLSKCKLFSTQILDKISAGRVDFFISNSKAIKRMNIKALGIPENKIKVIYRGRNFQTFSSLVKDGEFLLQESFNSNNKKVFLNVGRLIKSKGQLDLIVAFKKFLQRNPENVLLIVGEGPLRPNLEEKIKTLDLQHAVFLLGYREDVPDLLAVSNFFVFPSYFEGLPGALVEAIIAKKSCIASDIPENRECFPEHGALFFPPGDIETLVLRMEEALSLKDWEEKLKISYEHAERNFEIGNISREYENFYVEILRKKPQRSLI